ncbi:MAG TPA: c-type cytochrome [Sphingomonas sp.]|jgi:cytochrome c2|nr:c-type cytochrome [Sphingomonas sp.]
MPSSLRLVLILMGLGSASAPVAYAVLKHQDAQLGRTNAEAITGGDVTAGEAAFDRFGCGGCHRVRGHAGADGGVGPALDGIAVRAHIAGRLPNTPAAMVLWLRHPQRVIPGNGMPDQGIGERDARDLAAYLYTKQK